MIKKIVIYCIVWVFILTGCSLEPYTKNMIYTQEDIFYETNMKRDLLCLMMAYPEYIINVEKKDEIVYLIMKSGKKILYDDKRKKDIHERVENGDLQDMMEEMYPLGSVEHLMDENFDPGRIRNYELMKEVYGQTKEEIEKNLTNVQNRYQSFPFNQNNKAAKSLQEAMKEIEELIEKNKEIYSFVFPISGTFNYRLIAGTYRLSPHSFGTAIDLARDKRDYWKWTTRKEGEKRLIHYPKEIVTIFEKNNFIWGGKWGHFDILHFEYRPELILKSRYFGDDHKTAKVWYSEVPNDENIKKYIQIIENALK
ncbi:M15 family metallopeptidase [Inediibacterium massiliense]|uniref:M15 family metallopeptidase n=1 Tax=Inediibacterium massiliense TaxID=1658111 RepID=UPI0006B413DF|nr:M15 family metallopeptidase [Inediibacterium massiliense]